MALVSVLAHSVYWCAPATRGERRCPAGIGVPAVAASGAIAANTLASPWAHWQLLDAIGA